MLNQYIFFSIISICGRTIITSKYYYIFIKSKTIWQQKKSTCIKPIPYRINIFIYWSLSLFIIFIFIFKSVFILSPWSFIAFDCFSNAFPREEYVILVCLITWFGPKDNISLFVRYYLSILPDDNADNFATSLLIPYCTFSCLIF